MSFSKDDDWKRERGVPSLSEAYSSIDVPITKSVLTKFFAYAGPGLIIAVGYMDPGNWATDLEAGSRFGYELLFVIFLSNLMAMLLQHLSLKLGIAAERDLAQACRDAYSKPIVYFLWFLCEIAIVACDLAEVIGSAIALNLLFHLPLSLGILITGLDVLLILYLQEKGFRRIEAIVATLTFLIGFCFLYEILLAQPHWGPLMQGFVPASSVLVNPEKLYIGIGILGATVMPHNLYLHSSLAQTRRYARTGEGKREAIRYSTLDSNLALGFALFINAAILILSAAVFYNTSHAGLSDISDAYQLLAPMLGAPAASVIFALALLASGQNSTFTGTLAGQIVTEGFLEIRLKPWLRRLITRSLAIVPALVVAIIHGPEGIGRLLIFSQVILSLQLSFAVFPLISFTSSKKKMGQFRNSKLLNATSYFVAFTIAALNIYLVVKTLI